MDKNDLAYESQSNCSEKHKIKRDNTNNNNKYENINNKNTNNVNNTNNNTSNTDNSTTFYTSLVETLTTDKSEPDKIKALIILEQEVLSTNNNQRFQMFRIFDNFLNDSLSSNILKGQILMTGTTIFILTNAKEEHTGIFLNFVNNILVEHIKNTNNYSNIYLRQVSCQCLEELENEYPGLLFSLLGKKTVDLIESKESYFNDTKSFSASVKISKNKNDIPVYDKKIELENYGLSILIDEELFYVFQYYLSLYTKIFKHLIMYYIYNQLLLNKFIKEEIDNNSINNNNSNNNQNYNNNTTNNNNYTNNITNNNSSKYQEKYNQHKNLNHHQNNNLNNTNSNSNNHNHNNNNQHNNNHSNNHPNQELDDKEINLESIKDLHIKNNTSGNLTSIFNTQLSSIINSLPYINKITSTNKSPILNNLQSNTDSRSKINNNLFAVIDKQFDSLLHINHDHLIKYTTFINKCENEIDIVKTLPELTSVNSHLLSFVNKAISKIESHLSKTGELMNAKICTSLKFIISNIEINHKALLPHFSYFHFNSNSTILTLTSIKIVENFKNYLNESFILKLVFKLCLLINDLRISKALRILSIRWLLNLHFSNYNFDFAKYTKVFDYYLYPFSFDSLSVRIEKLKTLYLFHENSGHTEENTVMQSISLFDNYKYFPIFSDYVKSLFKAYFFIIVKFPKLKFIKNLCEELKENLKVVPRILPNMIHLLRKIKSLSSDVNNNPNNNPNTSNINENNMHPWDIYSFLLEEFTNFIKSFKPHTKLNQYFPLFIEIAKEPIINPNNLIQGLRNLYKATMENRNWKIENNILEVCMNLLRHHNLSKMKENKIETLLYNIHKRSFDYGIRDKAKLYFKLVTNVEKPMLNTFLDSNFQNFSSLKVNYNVIDYNIKLKNFLILKQSTIERSQIAKVYDEGSAFFDKKFKENIMLLSDICNKDIMYSNFVYKDILKSENNTINTNNINYNNSNNNHTTNINNNTNNINHDCVNEINHNYHKNINGIINNIITKQDILRLFVSNEMINETKDAQVDETKLFSKERLVERMDQQVEYFNENCFLEDYFAMINENKFYIKLPLNLYMNDNENTSNSNSSLLLINKLFSINICFGLKDHLEILQPILLPYLEKDNNDKDKENKANYKDKDKDNNENINSFSAEIENNNFNSNNNNNNNSTKKFPYFYKINLIIYPSYPIPSEIETQAIFYDSNGTCCTGKLNQIGLKFEDYFLPNPVPVKYEEHKMNKMNKMKELIFKNLWKSFKKSDISNQFINSHRTLDISKDKMINLVFDRLGPFLIDKDFLNTEYCVKINSIDDEIECNLHESDNNSNSNINSSNNSNSPNNNSSNSPFTNTQEKRNIIKEYYNNNNDNSYKSSFYDFSMDKILQKNKVNSDFTKYNILKQSKFNQAKVLIFVPKKYHILFKIKISDFSSIIQIRSDCVKIIEYLDEYFNSWENSIK